jgi:hypothetical protein
MAHQILSIRFCFVRLPVLWAVSNGLILGKFKSMKSAYEDALTEMNADYVRDEFFAVPENDIHKLAEFLNKVGAWPSSDSPSPNEPGHAMQTPLVVRPQNVWAFRDELRDALLGPLRKRLKEELTPIQAKKRTWADLYPKHSANNFPLQFELSNVAAGVVTLTNARHMLFATVLADVAHGIRFKVCKRKDCKKPFPLLSAHKRAYCGQYCGHLESVRRKRKVTRPANKLL